MPPPRAPAFASNGASKSIVKAHTTAVVTCITFIGLSNQKGQYRLYALTPADPKSQPCEKPETQGKTIHPVMKATGGRLWAKSPFQG
jgi:hypothetical protein